MKKVSCGHIDIGMTLFLGVPFVFLAVFVTWMKIQEPAFKAQMEAESQYIAANRCVVTQLHGGEATQYRCDTPKERYLSGKQLSQEAQAAAKPATK